MQKKVFIQGETDQKISAYLEQLDCEEKKSTKNTIILMIHDFPGNKRGNKNLFKMLGPTIGSKKYDAIRFDFCGCGESDGASENFTLETAGRDLRRIINWCKQEGYENFLFITEGLGASIISLNLIPNIRSLIMVSPILNLPDFSKNYFKKALESAENEDHVILKEQKISKKFINSLHSIDLTTQLENITCPVLILHGAQNKVAPIEQLDIARHHIPAKRFEITTFEDGDHNLANDNHRKFIFYHTMQFIEKYA